MDSTMETSQSRSSTKMVVIVMLDALLRGLQVGLVFYIGLTMWAIQLELYAAAPLFMLAGVSCGLLWVLVKRDH